MSDGEPSATMKGCGCTFACVGLVVGLFAFWPQGCGDKITLYQLLPPSGSSNLTLTANPRTFKVFPDRQEVVETNVGGTERWTKCAVADASNWRCTYPDAS